MKAVVMAGGAGSRLRPLTVGLPKPMVPIIDRPVMEHTLGLLKRHGIEEISGYRFTSFGNSFISYAMPCAFDNGRRVEKNSSHLWVCLEN